MKKIEIILENTNKNKRIDKCLSWNLTDYSRSFIQKLLTNENITVNDKIITKSSYKLNVGDRVIVNIPDENIEILPENIPLDIIFEDDDILVINKSSDMVVHPASNNYSGTLVNALLYSQKKLSNIDPIRPGIVHRLDKDTSGVIIVAKNNEIHEEIVEKFKNKELSKIYLCIVKGNFSQENLCGTIETLIGRDPKDRKKMGVVSENGKIAITHYKVLGQVDGYALLEVNIETGRTHQIRVHMKYINHPVLGDTVYGTKSKIATRQMLHSYHTIFDKYDLVAPLPEDFRKVAKSLKLGEYLDDK